MIVFYGLLRDGDDYVVLGYRADPIRPVTRPLARYSGNPAGLVAAILDISQRKV